MEWQILITEEYEEWFTQLSQKDKAAIAIDLEVLRHFGPQLGRPHVDQIKGSRYSNMKELRTKVSSKVYRSLFAFDPDRQAVILCGGDKRGKNQ
ncbi:MAG: type II toxin-antitoxin system RelE/ParE family toxin, partial [Candidatus Electrothrix sp. LOE2]|nr:type II toxin-antitoxin system RelE/ParE family toxin [Candidatus Electrothrix sp. LOE2]